MNAPNTRMRAEAMMPKTKIPTLGAVAAAQADEKTKAKRLGLLASIASALGLGDAVPSKPDAKMSKKTETTKHTIVEESDTDSGEEEEEEEANDSATDMTGSDADSERSESDAEEEEEEEEESSAKGKAKYEEEEEEEASAKGLGRALLAAFKSPAVKAAFLAAVPEKHRAAAALRTPDRLLREVRKATGARTVDGAMTALSRHRAKAATAGASAIKALAKVEQRVAKVETEGRAQRVDAMVAAAKSEGRAPIKALRAQLREHGNAHGTKSLSKLIASLPKVVRVPGEDRLPGADADGNVTGAPTLEAQLRDMATVDLGTEAERKQYDEIRAKVAAKNGAANGAAKGY